MNFEEMKWKHENLLYPIVRVFSIKGAGSGTIIYSKPDPENEKEFLTFVLTNHHVIEANITYKKDWDSLLKKKIEKEFREQAKVEVFSYVRDSEVDSSNRHNAEIVAYDQYHDLALLKLDSPKRFDYVSPIISKEKIKNLKLFTSIAIAGCSMAHEPFCNFGEITFLKEIIEQKKYIMVNAGMYFGNSGGAVFLADSGELIGVPSRLTGIQLGFGMDMVLFMGFAAHPERFYEFFDEQEVQFIYDSSQTYNEALKKRKKKEKDSRFMLKAKEMEEEKNEDTE